MSVRGSVLTGVLVGLLGAGGPLVASDGPEDAAQAAAESWLRLVDGANYASSWQQAAQAFRGAVKQSEWERMAEGARGPLGKLVSRKLKSREYTEKAPTTRVIGGKAYGWGDGKYVVIQYEAVFENKAAALETVTPMLDADGAWRVSGYFIR